MQCLYYLNSFGAGLQFGELCKLCHEDKAAISRTLKDLQKKELVAANGSDDKKYKNQILLTPSGKSISEKISQKINNFLEIGSAGLNDSKREQLYSTLALIENNLKQAYKNENNKEVEYD